MQKIPLRSLKWWPFVSRVETAQKEGGFFKAMSSGNTKRRSLKKGLMVYGVEMKKQKQQQQQKDVILTGPRRLTFGEEIILQGQALLSKQRKIGKWKCQSKWRSTVSISCSALTLVIYISNACSLCLMCYLNGFS